MGSAVLGRGLNIDSVSYRPSLNRLSPAGGSCFQFLLPLGRKRTTKKLLAYKSTQQANNNKITEIKKADPSVSTQK